MTMVSEFTASAAACTIAETSLCVSVTVGGGGGEIRVGLLLPPHEQSAAENKMTPINLHRMERRFKP
jgi:hypothetical protein